MLIKLILVLAIGVVLAYFLANRDAMHLRAGKKLLFLAFVVASVVSIFNPNWLNAVANFLGVGRGADLLLYMLIVTFVFVSLNIYLKFRELATRQAKIVRSLGLLEEKLKEAEAKTDKK